MKFLVGLLLCALSTAVMAQSTTRVGQVDDFNITSFPLFGTTVTPHDTNALAFPGMIRADADGTVTAACYGAGGNTIAAAITLELVAGEFFPCIVSYVLDTGTDAISIHIFDNMSGRIEVPAKKVSETLTLSFDFTKDLVVGETISTAVCTASVYSGVDLVPEDILDGAAVIDEGVVTQDIIDGTLGVVYSVICGIVTSDAKSRVKSAFVAIGPNLP